MDAMTPTGVIEAVRARYGGLVAKEAQGETALFYDPGGALPSGAYFLTVKTGDGENDRASELDREGAFRVSFALSPDAYRERFGEPLDRPTKGGVVATGHDVTAVDGAYALARERFERRVGGS